MKKNTGKVFESLTKEVFDVLTSNTSYTNVEADVKLPGPDGDRQIDVLVTSDIAGIQVRTIIECRDYNKRLDVTHIDGLHSKMQDVAAQKAVFVTRKGYSKNASNKAKRIGISLCTLHKAKDELQNIGFQIPFIVTVIEILDFEHNFQATFGADEEINMLDDIKFNDAPVGEIFRDALIDGTISYDDIGSKQSWHPENLQDEVSLQFGNGKRHAASKINFNYSISLSYYFGYLHDLENTITLINQSEENANVIFRLSDLLEFDEQFSRYSTLEDIPHIPETVSVKVCLVPEVSSKIGLGHMHHVESGRTFEFDSRVEMFRETSDGLGSAPAIEKKVNILKFE